jgi:V-type H+-transporting ATPase subunit a
MFGDIGHGGAVLAFSIWLLKSESAKKLLPDVYKARYLLFLMGFFSFYSGWIYNEFFALPLNVFGSCYEKAPIEEYAAKE